MAFLPASRIAGQDHDMGTLLNLGCFHDADPAAGGPRRGAPPGLRVAGRVEKRRRVTKNQNRRAGGEVLPAGPPRCFELRSWNRQSDRPAIGIGQSSLGEGRRPATTPGNPAQPEVATAPASITSVLGSGTTVTVPMIVDV